MGNNSEIHIEGEDIETLILALCCLEVLWEEHPDVVKEITISRGMPGGVAHGARAQEIRKRLSGR